MKNVKQSHDSNLYERAIAIRQKYIQSCTAKKPADGLSFNLTLLQLDRFKKIKKRRPPLYLGKRVNLGIVPRHLQPLPTNGLVLMNGISVRATNTCCLDVILMTLCTAYKEDKLLDSRLEFQCESLIDCIRELSQASSVRDVQKAHAKFIL